MNEDRLEILKWCIVVVVLAVMVGMAWYVMHRINSWMSPGWVSLLESAPPRW